MAMMLVAEIEPQAGMARRSTDHRKHVGQAWPRAHPGLCIDRLPEGKQPVRLWQRTRDLHRVWWRIAVGKLDRRCEANAAIHRRQHEGLIGVELCMIEH